MSKQCKNCVFWERDNYLPNSDKFGECKYAIDTMDDEDITNANKAYLLSSEYSQLITHEDHFCNQFVESK